MKRRKFLGFIGGAVSAWPLVSSAQAQLEKMHRIGILFGLAENDHLGQSHVKAFREKLQELGWIEERNIHIDYRWAEDDPERIHSYASELVKLKPDVIVCQSGLTLPALQHETRDIPIVFTVIVDPVASGFVSSLAHPGGNVTGFADAELATAEKMLAVLKEMVPALDNAAVILNPEQAPQRGMLAAIQSTAPRMDVIVTPLAAHDQNEITRAMEAVSRTAKSGLIVLPNPITNRYRNLIISLAARYRLPAAYRYSYFVVEGGLISYGEILNDQFRGAASYVDQILKGSKPGDLPVQQPANFELAINLQTAKALGITAPAHLLARADKFVE